MNQGYLNSIAKIHLMNRNIFHKSISFICLAISQLSTSSQNLSLAWSKEFTNPQTVVGGNVTGWAVQKNGNGDIIVVGNFSNTADFDPGPGVANLSSLGGTDIFIAKYDPSGNYIYARSFGGLGNESPFNLAIDAAGYIYMAGGYSGTPDFDPGPGVVNLPTAGGIGDFFVAKYDADGNYVFANGAGGINYDEATSLKVDAAGNVYATGYFSGTPDFDPGPGVVNLPSSGPYNIFLVKYDINGNYVFAKNIGGPDSELGNALALDGSGNIYIAGGYSGTVDFDPGPGVANLTAGPNDIFLAKYDANGNYIFAKTMASTNNNNEANDITIDGSGNIYMTGHYTGTPDMDPGAGVAALPFYFSSAVFFAKYDANGNYLFAYGTGGAFGGIEGHRILLDVSGNIFVIGYFGQTADLDPGPGVANLTASGSDDAFLAKYDINGNYVFAKAIGGTSPDKAWGLFIDVSGNAIITGSFANTVDFDPGPGTSNLTAGAGATNAYVAGYTNNGNYQFAGMLGGYGASAFPDLGNDVALDGSGNVYIIGSFTGTVDFDPGPGVANLTSTVFNTADIFIAKYDAAGNYLYAKQMGGIGADNANSLFVDPAGNVYVTGTFSGTADFDPGAGVVNLVSLGIWDIFFAKYDASGNYVYAKSIGGSSIDNGAGISVDGSNNVYITGYYNGTVDFNPGAGVANLVSAGSDDMFFAKYDASGNYVYAKSIGGTGFDNGFGIKADGSGNVYVTGSFSGTADFDPGAGVVNLVSAGGADIYIAKYNTSGNYVYAKSMGGTGTDNGNNIKVDGNENVYVTGYFTGTADFDPGAGVVNLVSAGGNDIFAAKYDANGNYIYAKGFGGTGNDAGNKISVDVTGNIYVAGSFSNTVDFDPGSGVVNLVSAGSADIFIAKYNTSGNYVYAKSMGGTASDNGRGLIYDGGGNIYMTGDFTGTADFDPNSGTQTQSAWNSSDIYLVKLTECLAPEISGSSTTSVLTTISGATIITDGGCSLLASILPNGTSPLSGTLSAKSWVENSVPTFGGEPFVQRHYEVTPTTNPSTSTARLTLYFTQQEFDNFNAHPASFLDLPANPTDASGKTNLRIGKYSGTSSNGTGMPGTYAAPAIILNPDDADIIWNSTNNRWEVSFDVDGFSGFIVQTSAIALPVTLLEFKGRIINDNALLSWKTENEQHADKTIIERSLDGRNYSAIGAVMAYNTAGTHSYNFTDIQVNLLSTDILYYRLKQVDIGGRYSYSGIVALSLSNKNITLLYPNPVQDKLTLLITTGKSEKLQMSIIDNTGRVIRKKELNISAGSISTQWNIHGLATGVYSLRIEGEGIHQNMRFIKQ